MGGCDLDWWMAMMADGSIEMGAASVIYAVGEDIVVLVNQQDRGSDCRLVSSFRLCGVLAACATLSAGLGSLRPISSGLQLTNQSLTFFASCF